jgi:DNA-binding NarL/FixJ family response regulator
MIVEEMTLLAEMLEHELKSNGMQVVGQGSDWTCLPEEIAKAKPQAVIWGMPDQSEESLAALRHTRASNPSIPILVLAHAHVSPAEVIHAGASGIVLKTAPPRLVLQALDAVAKGGKWLQREMTAALFQEVVAERSNGAANPAISTRQGEIVSLLAQGCTNAEISQRLYVTESTVKSHVNRVLKSLQLKNRVELTRWAIAQGLVRIDSGDGDRGKAKPR